MISSVMMAVLGKPEDSGVIDTNLLHLHCSRFVAPLDLGLFSPSSSSHGTVLAFEVSHTSD